MIHFIINNPGHENYAHVHFSKGKDGFLLPTGPFGFPEHANPQHDYDASLGNWQVLDKNGDGKDDLVHDPKLYDGRIHTWLSKGDGTFELQ